MDTSLLVSLERVLIRQPGLALAYLFGSQATGHERPDSDLDLALLWDEKLDARAREAEEDALRAAPSEELGAFGERADLLDLRRAGMTVAFRAIRDGKPVFVRDRRLRRALEARIARRYGDEAPYRELFRRAAARAGRKVGEAVRDRS